MMSAKSSRPADEHPGTFATACVHRKLYTLPYLLPTAVEPQFMPKSVNPWVVEDTVFLDFPYSRSSRQILAYTEKV
jgi:hypothetical protein